MGDLLFRDVTDKLSILQQGIDITQVLGLDYVALLKGLRHEGTFYPRALKEMIFLYSDCLLQPIDFASLYTIYCRLISKYDDCCHLHITFVFWGVVVGRVYKGVAQR